MASKPRKTAAHAAGSAAARILAAAEQLLAASSYDGVALRMITGAAEVERALVNDYFGAQLEWFRAVVRRRAETLHAERMTALDSAATMAALIGAFTAPFHRERAPIGTAILPPQQIPSSPTGC